MSIAVSAVVKPSGLLSRMVCGMAALCVGAGLVIGFGGIGELPVLHRFPIAGFCILAAMFAVFKAFNSRKTFRIDISGIGQIRLREYIELTASSGQSTRADAQGSGRVVQLMADSTIWAHFMLLRLKDSDGRTVALPVFRDCMTQDGFHALSVACRWIAAQNNRADSMTA